MNQNTKTIFISYGRDENNPQDVELVRKVKQNLEAKGFEVLMDEEQLRTSHDWEIKLEEMIRKSDWILFFITPYSARRPEGYCLNELAMSIAYKKPIAPVMVNYEVPPLSICRVQYLDLQALRHDEDYQKKIKEIVNVINEEESLGFEGEHLRTLTELSPIKFEATIARHNHGFTGREWIYEEVDRWLKEEESSRILWIMAEAGFGKSAIATYLAKTHPSAISVYFCQYDYSESKDPRELLKVLIYELSTQMDEYQKILKTLDIKETLKKSAEHIFTQLLLEPLQLIGKKERKFFFVIDALDEAEEDGKNEIVELIANRFLDLPPCLNIVITSRPEPELLKKLKKFNPIELKADDDRNRSDLEFFLRKQEKISDEETIRALIKKCEGNILYLKSIFELEMIKNGDISLEKIEKLPNSMEGFYLTYFERKFGDVKLYEEKYLAFVSLLVAYEGMPELLLRDILDLSEREYKRIKNNFGSLLEVDGNILTFYHKSIYEWLSDYDKSGNYSADIKMGKEKFQGFINSLTAETYREEYLEFEFLNRKLIDRIYEQDKSLEKFFEMLKSLDDTKQVIEALGALGKHYVIHNRMHRAIELLEEELSITEELYQNSSEKWVKEYIDVLINISIPYKKTNQIDKAIKLEEKCIGIVEKLYHTNQDHWAEAYLNILHNLAISYKKTNQIDKAVKLEEKCMKITKKLYRTNPNRWVELYVELLMDLGISFKNSNRLEDAVKLHEKSLSVSKSYYQKNKNRWAEIYTRSLMNVALTYKSAYKLEKAIVLLEEGRAIQKPLYEESQDRWAKQYTVVLINLAIAYKEASRTHEAIELEKECLGIRKKLYNKNPDRWAEHYTLVLINLGTSYSMVGELDEAVKLQQESLSIRKSLYMGNHDRWLVFYSGALSSLSRTYSMKNNFKDALELLLELHRILQLAYGDNNSKTKEVLAAVNDIKNKMKT